jgi:tRNA/tmRNA/rRNA uracil-C5-methylase (TrmA/RlmC/RlmD family)
MPWFASASLTQPNVLPILGTESPLGYRNKATYPLARSPEGNVKAGYFRQGQPQTGEPQPVPGAG